MDGAEARKKEIDGMVKEFKKRFKFVTKIVNVEKGMLCKVVVGKTAPGEDPPVKVFYEPAEPGDEGRVVLVVPKAKNN